MADPNELKEFQDLYTELQKPGRKTPEYEEFLAAIKSLDGKMSTLYRKDKYGRIPLVKQEDKEELLALHKTLGEKAELFLKDPGNMPAVPSRSWQASTTPSTPRRTTTTRPRARRCTRSTRKPGRL